MNKIVRHRQSIPELSFEMVLSPKKASVQEMLGLFFFLNSWAIQNVHETHFPSVIVASIAWDSLNDKRCGILLKYKNCFK